MKKINLILITLFAIIGALLIYNYFDKNDYNKTNNNIKINNEYTLLNESVFINKSIDQINKVFNNENGIIFLCIKENEWCNYYAKNLNDIAVENNINEIYYLNIKQDRQYNTNEYRKLVNNIEEYLLKDDENNKKIFVPTVIFIKNGKIIGYDNETSIMLENISPSEYYDKNKLNNFKNKILEFILKYKEEL